MTARASLRPPLVCEPGDATPESYPWLGGKGANLARLARWGQPVPSWYGVTTVAFARCLEDVGLAGEIAALLAGRDGGGREWVRAASREIRGLIGSLELAPEVLEAVRAAHGRCVAPGEAVAVRSSAAGEDGARASFAGLHESVLGVVGPESVIEALRTVWASAYGEAALAYRLARGLPLGGIAMGVVVQRMVRPRVSAVLFTCHPVTGDPREMVISALYGLGSGVVDGDLAADRYVVDRETLRIRAELARKERARVLEEGAVREVEVSPELRERSSLAQEQVRTLARAGLEIERRMGRPQDVELAIDADGALSILQSRPVPAATVYGPAAGNRCVWDLSNWTENYPGLTLPMTYSIARRFDRIGHHCFAGMMRMSPRKLREAAPLFETSLGYVRGHVCSNRVDRYRFFRLIPGIDFHRPALLGLLRVRPDEVDPELDRPRPGPWRRWLVELPLLLRTLGGLAWDALWARSRVRRLLHRAERFYARFDDLDLTESRPRELVALYEEAERELAWRWRAPLENALFLRISYVALSRCCRAWCGGREGVSAGELLRGAGGAGGATPVRELMKLSAMARSDPEVRELLLERSPAQALAELAGRPRFEAFARALEGYLDRFAHTSFTPMKLEAPTLGDRPELLVGMLRAHLAREERGPGAAAEAAEGEAAGEAERRALEAMGGSLPGPLRRLAFAWLLARTRRLDGQREEVKAARVRLMDLIRRLVRALGEELARESILGEAQDVFYLTLEEVFDYVRGNAVTSDLRGLAAVRRGQVEEWRSGPGVAERFETYGLPYHRNDVSAPEPVAGEREAGRLRGTGCSRGRTTGPVRRADPLVQPSDLRGEILALEQVHAGWIPFLPSVSGLLVERGEILSHWASMARELGIPTIVGVAGLMRTIRDGETVTIDGELGTIECPGSGERPEEGTEAAFEPARARP